MSSLNNQDSHSHSHLHSLGNGTAASSRTTSTTTTGGLLLLSTKKSVMNSIGNASSNVNVKRISTHDALMNALNGDSGDRAKEKVPLAWGLKAPTVSGNVGVGVGANVSSGSSASASAAANAATASVSASTLAATPVNVAAASTTSSSTTTGASNTGNNGHGETNEHNIVHDGSGDQSNYAKAKAISTPAAALPTSNSNSNSNINSNINDNSSSSNNSSSNNNAPNVVLNQDANYNSNHNPNPNNNNNNPTIEMKKQQDPPAENQVEFMKKLAKERAEKRRLEEEERVAQQKERAQQRLLELDLKLQKKPPSFDNHNVVVVPSHDRSHNRSHSPNVNPNVNTNDNTITKTNTNAPSKPITSIAARHNVMPQEPASRFSDPSRSYSSLLGGGAGAGAAQSHLQDSNNAAGTGTTASGYMVHLSNYDDRDRGGRSAGAGPRMLFDHKSGSMVKVPAGGSNSSSKEKKSSKKKLLPRNDRDKDKDVMHGNDRGNDRGNEEYSFQGSGSANGLMEDDEDDDDFHGESGTSRRSARYRQRAAKRSAKRDDKSLSVKPRKASMGKHESTSVKVGRALPRTCGVLYKRDANGQFVSADGCEGDQGYGAHSVPGGRLRNSKAYGSLKQKGRALGKQEKNSSTAAFPSDPPTDGFDTPAYLGRHAHSHSGLSSSNADYDYNRGLNRSHFMRKSQQPMADTYADTSAEVPSSVSHVVTGDERFDLLSGLDASPKLQATAAAWAPSEAVLALAAANSQKTESDRISPPPQESDYDSHEDISESEYHALNAMALIDNESGHDEEECHLEASPSIGLGLGFDPSQNMDSLMMSPTMEDETPLDVPGLSNFDLKESAAALPKSSSNSFLGTTSILGSSTWGTSAAGNLNTMGSLSNWDLLGRAEDDVQKKQSPSAFLSLGQHTWGSGTANAFNGFNIDSPSMESSD